MVEFRWFGHDSDKETINQLFTIILNTNTITLPSFQLYPIQPMEILSFAGAKIKKKSIKNDISVGKCYFRGQNKLLVCLVYITFLAFPVK